MTDHHFNHAAAPLRIGRVRLRVRDLASVSDFYRDVLGLTVLERTTRGTVLGSARAALLELAGDPEVRPQDRRAAGLFHTAFLLPDRASLGRWIAHAAGAGVRLQGASDHLVSEALYLADPEGNGIEVYADRPVSHWHDADGSIRMATEPLDIPALLAAGRGAWSGFPADGIIGHVHLQVGDTLAADGFYRDILGLDVSSRYPGASFYGSGGYHHHLAGNTWNSRGAGRRSAGGAGLESVELIARDAATLAAILDRARAAGLEIEARNGTPVLRDPWGTAIALAG